MCEGERKGGKNPLQDLDTKRMFEKEVFITKLDSKFYLTCTKYNYSSREHSPIHTGWCSNCILVHVQMHTHRALVRKVQNMEQTYKRATLTAAPNTCSVKGKFSKDGEYNTFTWQSFKTSCKFSRSVFVLVCPLHQILWHSNKHKGVKKVKQFITKRFN